MTLDPRYVIENPQVSYRTSTGWVNALTGESTIFEWPNDHNVGVHAIPGWTPTFEVTDNNLEIFEEGAVVQDFRVTNGVVLVRAPHVTIRRAELINSGIFNDYGNVIFNDLTIEDVTIRSDPPGKWFPNVANTAILSAGYTCRRVAIIDTNEGVHTGGSMLPLVDPTHPQGRMVRLYDCYTRITGPQNPVTGIYCMEPDGVGYTDYHGDCCQAEDGFSGGIPLKIRNCAWYSMDKNPPGSEHDEYGCGASAILYLHRRMDLAPPGTNGMQSQPPDIYRLIVSGAATSLHTECGGDFREVLIENGTWIYAPLAIEPGNWPLMTTWEVWMVDIDPVTGQPIAKTAKVPHGYPGYGPMDPP